MSKIDDRLLDCEGEPEITENFNRVLGIIDEGGGGGAGAVIVHLTATATEDEYEADIADADLYEAVVTEGYMAYVEIPDELTRAQIVSADYDEEDDIYTFTAVITASVEGVITTYTVVGEDGIWTYTVSQANTLPAATAQDEGKVPTVDNNGDYVLATPAGGLPAVTSTDEGKFLVVNAQGEWAATTIPNADNMSF